MASVVWYRLTTRKICEKCLPSRDKNSLIFFRKVSHKPKKKSEWHSVVGLEIHAQINTVSKLFSGAATRYGSPINAQVSHFDAALPGTLPVLNKKCVEAGVMTALALGCEISPISTFDRKHYFYADLPAGYQITQQRQPLARGGQLTYVHVPAAAGPPAESRTCRLIQLQLEQDSGKSLHDQQEQRSLIDLNRAGIGLMEIVTYPDLRDGEDAASFVQELQLLLKAIGTCDCKMQEGSLRVDANISVHREGEPWGTRTEVKNINSIRNVSKAIDNEIERHIKVLEEGGVIENETRSFDAVSGETVQMRDKEKLLDYRFMPEPNLPPLHVYRRGDVPVNLCGSTVVLEELLESLPELPSQKKLRLQQTYNVPVESVSLLMKEEGLLEIFESIVAADSTRDAKNISSFLQNCYVGVLREKDITASESALTGECLREVSDMYASRQISKASAHKLLLKLIENPHQSASEIVDQENWRLISDRELIEAIVTTVLNENPKALKRVLKSGKQNLDPVIGPVQQRLEKRGDERIISEVILRVLEER